MVRGRVGPHGERNQTVLREALAPRTAALLVRGRVRVHVLGVSGRVDPNDGSSPDDSAPG